MQAVREKGRGKRVFVDLLFLLLEAISLGTLEDVVSLTVVSQQKVRKRKDEYCLNNRCSFVRSFVLRRVLVPLAMREYLQSGTSREK